MSIEHLKPIKTENSPKLIASVKIRFGKKTIKGKIINTGELGSTA